MFIYSLFTVIVEFSRVFIHVLMLLNLTDGVGLMLSLQFSPNILSSQETIFFYGILKIKGVLKILPTWPLRASPIISFF